MVGVPSSGTSESMKQKTPWTGTPSRATVPVGAIGRVERRQIQLLNGIDDEPREVALRQPPANIRRHQKYLLAITRDEVLPHQRIVLNPSDSSPVHAAEESDRVCNAREPT